MEALYKAKKGNIQFFIQPYMIEAMSAAGFEIIKLEEYPVWDIQEEVRNIERMEENTYEN